MTDEAREGIITGFGTVTIDIEAFGNYRIETLGACGLGEITPEMIEVGLAAWSEYDERFESSDEMIERVYRAMSIKAKESVCVAEGR